MAPSIMQKISAPARSSPYLKLNSDDKTGSITAWRRHVDASHALPPSTIAQNAPNELNGIARRENGFRTLEFYRPPILSGRYKLVVPPTSVRGTILRRLARLIDMYEIPETLRSLPCPILKPLVCCFNSSHTSKTHTILSGFVLELRPAIHPPGS